MIDRVGRIGLPSCIMHSRYGMFSMDYKVLNNVIHVLKGWWHSSRTLVKFQRKCHFALKLNWISCIRWFHRCSYCWLAALRVSLPADGALRLNMTPRLARLWRPQCYLDDRAVGKRRPAAVELLQPSRRPAGYLRLAANIGCSNAVAGRCCSLHSLSS